MLCQMFFYSFLALIADRKDGAPYYDQTYGRDRKIVPYFSIQPSCPDLWMGNRGEWDTQLFCQGSDIQNMEHGYIELSEL